MEEPGQARFFDNTERASPEHLPMVKSLNEHRPLGEIEHGAWTEDPHHLAESNLVVCHRSRSLQLKGWP
jgi:hypothetical protein